MATVFLVLAIVCMVGVLGALFTGFLAMGRGGDFNKKYGNRLMQARIILQAAAVGFLVLWFLAGRA